MVTLPEDYRPRSVRVWFRPVDTSYFYWLIPVDAKTGVVGLIADDGALARKHLDRFLEMKGFAPLSYQSARIPRYARWTSARRRVPAGDVYLVGDAAGHVKVSTVGGIVNGLQGARAVVDSILSRRHSPQLRGLRRELDVHLWVRRALSRFDEDDYCRLLEALGGSATEVLATTSRDEGRRVVRRLLARRPRFAWMGLRAIVPKGH
jgi:flavin-dependent dehydrogenase